MNPIYAVLLGTVVVGKDVPIVLYMTFQEMFTEVPASFILMISFCPSEGVPAGASIVMSPVMPNILNCSDVFASGVIVPLNVEPLFDTPPPPPPPVFA